jgi:SnoaL-like domain
VLKESPAIARARAHVEAWSNRDFDTARTGLAADVKVTATTTGAYPPDTNLTGIDAYMGGLIAFAEGVVPGSLRVIDSVGDERNALLMLTVEAAFGPDGSRVTLPAARLYLFDEDGKIKVEQVVFYVGAD